jgi:hypothetical protein
MPTTLRPSVIVPISAAEKTLIIASNGSNDMSGTYTGINVGATSILFQVPTAADQATIEDPAWPDPDNDAHWVDYASEFAPSGKWEITTTQLSVSIDAAMGVLRAVIPAGAALAYTRRNEKVATPY